MNNTGDVLPKSIKGPLINLLSNLSGEHSEYWLKALKKMLRKEEIPQPPPEVLKEMKSYDFRTAALERIQEIADYLKTISTIKEVCLVDDEHDLIGLINIGVYPNTTDFFREIKNQEHAPFYLNTDGNVQVGKASEKDIDATYEKWVEKYSFKENKSLPLKDFCKAVIDLGLMYEEAILKIEF